MEFKIVDVPITSPSIQSVPIVEALVSNVGKAVAYPIPPGMDSNTLRKMIRAALDNRGLLRTYKFHTRLSHKRTLIMWLHAIVPDEGEV